MATWFTGDTHFCHQAILGPKMHCDRSRFFSSLEEHDEELIRRWNEVVAKTDEVWHLGDFAMTKDETRMRAIFHRLNGRKNLIIGNHDERALKLPWASKQDIYIGHLDHTPVCLLHYGMRVWPRMHRDKNPTIHLFGHSHNSLPGCSLSTDVGVDAWDFRPVSLHQIRERLAKQKPAFPEVWQQQQAAE